VTHLDRLPGYVAPGLLRPAPPRVDWTVTTHHFLVADLTYCTLCGAHPEVLDLVLARAGAFGIAVVYCLPCRSADPDRDHMRVALERRYGADRYAD
jgi:hypothetical protein